MVPNLSPYTHSGSDSTNRIPSGPVRINAPRVGYVSWRASSSAETAQSAADRRLNVNARLALVLDEAGSISATMPSGVCSSFDTLEWNIFSIYPRGANTSG